MGYFLIVLSVCASLTEGFLIKNYNKKHEKGGFIFIALVSAFSMLFFLCTDLIADKMGLRFPSEMFPYALAAGFVYCMASLFTFFALKYGSYALTMLIVSYSLIFSTLYGVIFLQEQATVFTYVGFALIALSLFFVRGETMGEVQEKQNLLLWLIFVSLSVVCAGMFGVVQRMQQIRFQDAVTREFMVVAMAFSALASFVIGLCLERKDSFQVLKHCVLYAGGAGIANGTTNMLNMLVTMLMPISIFAPTQAGIKIVISFLMSYFIFKEKFLKRQILGVFLGGVAVVLLNI